MLVSRLTSDVQSLDELVREALVEIVGSSLQIVLTMVALAILSPKLALISLVALPILIASSWSFHHSAGRVYHAIRDRVAETLTALQEGLAGVRVVQAFRREARDDGALPAAQPRADPRVAASVVREHQAVRVPAARAGGGAHRRAHRRRDDVRERLDLDRNGHGVRPVPDPALRPHRAFRGMARRVPAGPGGAREDRRAARRAEPDPRAAGCARAAGGGNARPRRRHVRLRGGAPGRPRADRSRSSRASTSHWSARRVQESPPWPSC